LTSSASPGAPINHLQHKNYGGISTKLSEFKHNIALTSTSTSPKPNSFNIYKNQVKNESILIIICTRADLVV